MLHGAEGGGPINEAAPVWLDSATGAVAGASGAGLFPIGVAVEAAAPDAATVVVRLTGVPVEAVAGGT